jgi:hypothetical protein
MKPRNFHESYAGGEIKPPSERSTGLVFGAVAVVVTVLSRDRPSLAFVALGMAIGVTAVSLIAPRLLRPLNLLWWQFGLLLHRIVNPLVMLAIFTLMLVPVGMIMRIWRDPLRSRRMPGASSYWIERKESMGAPASMTTQF